MKFVHVSALAVEGSELEAFPQAEAQARPSERELMLLVHRQMRLFAGPSQELDDLAQTALEQVLVARFEGRSKFATFTHSICYRVWLNHLRFRYRFQRLFSWTAADDAPEAIEPSSAHVDLEELERARRLYASLAQVAPKRRAVVLLHDIYEEEIGDIAAIVEAGEATVRTRLRDGRKQLRELLKADPYFSAPGGADDEL